jgi:hypothetical protein
MVLKSAELKMLLQFQLILPEEDAEKVADFDLVYLIIHKILLP